MTKADLINAIAESTKFTKKDAEAALKATTDAISAALAKGEKVQIVGFGTFEVRDRKEKEITNPRTKEKMIQPAKRVPAFKAGKNLKEAVDAK